MEETRLDKKIDAAVIALTRTFHELLDRVMKDNYDLSQQIKQLKNKVDDHQDSIREYCPHANK